MKWVKDLCCLSCSLISIFISRSAQNCLITPFGYLRASSRTSSCPPTLPCLAPVGDTIYGEVRALSILALLAALNYILNRSYEKPVNEIVLLFFFWIPSWSSLSIVSELRNTCQNVKKLPESTVPNPQHLLLVLVTKSNFRSVSFTHFRTRCRPRRNVWRNAVYMHSLFHGGIQIQSRVIENWISWKDEQIRVCDVEVIY